MNYPISGNVTLGNIAGNIKLYINDSGSGNLTGIGYYNNYITFGVNKSTTATPEMIIHQVGNVGIGTTTPIYRLDINGNVRSSDIRIDNATIHLGQNAGLTTQGANSIAIGYSAGQTSQGINSIAIGDYAGSSALGPRNIYIGGNSSGSGINSIAIGYSATTSIYNNSVAIGSLATSTASNQIILGTVSTTVICPNSIEANTVILSSQPKKWFLTTTGGDGNSYTPAGSNIGAYTNVGGRYWNNVVVSGGASSSAWNTTTATFTAPEKGYYTILLSIFNNGTSTSGKWLEAKGTVSFGGTSISQVCNYNKTYLAAEGTDNVFLSYWFNSGETFYFYCAAQSPLLFYASGHTTLSITKAL